MYDGEVVWEDAGGSHFRQGEDENPIVLWMSLAGLATINDGLLILVTIKHRVERPKLKSAK